MTYFAIGIIALIIGGASALCLVALGMDDGCSQDLLEDSHS